MTRRHWFALGSATAALQIFAPVTPGFRGGWEMLTVARTLATRGEFADPFSILATGPTAMVPPVYPIVLAGLLHLFGDTPLFVWMTITLCCAVHGLYAALLPDLGRRLLNDDRAGQAAAALACFVPAFTMMPQWDTIYTATALLAYLLYARPVDQPAAWLGTGALAGLMSLLNPITLPVTGLRTLWLLPRRPRAALLLAAWGLGAALAAGPWLARNHAVLGTWNARTNFGTTFYTSNNDCAEPGIVEIMRSGCYDRYQVNKNLDEAKLAAQIGEAAYDHLRTADTWAWIGAHPGQFADLTRSRIRRFWFPSPRWQTPYAIAGWITSILGFAGLLWMARRRAPGAGYLIAVCLVLPLPYYVIFSDIRYRAPFLWASQLPAGYCLARAISWVQSRRSGRKCPAPSPPSAADTPTTAPGGAPSGSPST